MLSTDKISGAFLAIIEEAEKLLEKGGTPEAEQGLKSIVSIAKHQSDIRGKSGAKGPVHSRCIK